MKKHISLLFLVSFALLQCSCDQSVTNNYIQEGAGDRSASSTGHTLITNAPGPIISYEDMAAIERGQVMKLRVNRDHFDVWEVNVVFDGLYKEGPERLILCHSNSDFPIGAGDSGSPLLTSDGRVAGILCYGYYGNSNDFIARAVEDVLSIEAAGGLKQSSSLNFAPVQPVHIVSGYNAQAASRYSLLGARLGQYTMLSPKPFITGNTLSKTSLNLSIPGVSIAVMNITGDYINSMAIGTMSYSRNGTMFAFGHSYESFLAAPTYLASTKSFIKSVTQSFKMSEVSDQFIGSMVKDEFNGILIKENVQPLVADVISSYTIDGAPAIIHHHKISNTPDFKYDKTLAADLSCYLLYLELLDLRRSQDTLAAVCTLQIETEKGTKTATFSLKDRGVDYQIYYYIRENIEAVADSKELKRFNLTVDLK